MWADCEAAQTTQAGGRNGKYILPCTGYHSMHLTVIPKNFGYFGVNRVFGCIQGMQI